METLIVMGRWRGWMAGMKEKWQKGSGNNPLKMGRETDRTSSHL